MSGHLRKTSGNHKWWNCNEPIGRCAVRNGLRKVVDFSAELFEAMHSFVDLLLENKFAIGSSDKNVAICYYEKDQRFWAAEMIKKKPKSTVTCIAWHPNNQLLAVGSCDYRCRLERSLCGVFSSNLDVCFTCRIYSAYISAVDGQPQTSAWGSITEKCDLLHELQSGLFQECSSGRRENSLSGRIRLDPWCGIFSPGW